MSTKEQIIANLDIVELSRANTMARKAKKRLFNAFMVVRQDCAFRTIIEPFGFEGETASKCNNDKHKYAGAMYTTCSPSLCPHANE